MASPAPATGLVTDDEYDSLKRFHWGNVRPEILSDLEFIINLPQNPALDYAALGPLLPPKEKGVPKKTLFVDLDETLAHTSIDESTWPVMVPCDLTFESEADGSERARVYFRPWVTDFLRIASHYYEIVLYTASVKLYADTIVDRLDVERRISHRLYRDHCTQYGNSEIYFKDLHGTGRRLEDSIIIDNRLISFGLNVENGIFVSSFTGEWGDTELLHLIPLLIALSKQPNVRDSIVKTYQLPQILSQYRDYLGQLPTQKNSKGMPRTVASRIGAFGNVEAHQLAGDQKLSKHMAAADLIGQDYLGSSNDVEEDEDGDEGQVDEMEADHNSNTSTDDEASTGPDVSNNSEMKAAQRFADERAVSAPPQAMLPEIELPPLPDTPQQDCATPTSIDLTPIIRHDDPSVEHNGNGEIPDLAMDELEAGHELNGGASEGVVMTGVLPCTLDDEDDEDEDDLALEAKESASSSRCSSSGMQIAESDHEGIGRDPVPISNPVCRAVIEPPPAIRERDSHRSASRHLAALAELSPEYPQEPTEAGVIQPRKNGRIDPADLVNPVRRRRMRGVLSLPRSVRESGEPWSPSTNASESSRQGSPREWNPPKLFAEESKHSRIPPLSSAAMPDARDQPILLSEVIQRADSFGCPRPIGGPSAWQQSIRNVEPRRYAYTVMPVSGLGMSRRVNLLERAHHQVGGGSSSPRFRTHLQNDYARFNPRNGNYYTSASSVMSSPRLTVPQSAGGSHDYPSFLRP